MRKPHTPGPWERFRNKIVAGPGRIQIATLILPDPSLATVMPDYDKQVEYALGNGDLMGAAADMEEMLEALIHYEWTVRRTHLYDEEGVEGWVWEDGSADGVTVVGDHSELPAWDDKCRAALAKRKGIVPTPTPRSEMASFLDNLVNPPKKDNDNA